jgi:ligand-binding sensor domain-containing protein/DNA-binding CsgD family transcriptional regulator
VNQLFKALILTKALLLLCCIDLYSQETSPIQTFPAEVTSAGSQNWEITQDNEQVIYLANNKGLLRYNGAQWDQFPTPDNSIMRSVKAIGDRIYSGSYMDFGYWEKTTTGGLSYNSLVDQLELKVLEDEQFWNIIDFGKLIVFQSLDRLLFVDLAAKKVEYIHSENTLLKSFKLEDQLYFQEQKKGLYYVEKGRPVLLSDHPTLQSQRIVQLFKRDQRFLVLTRESGFFWIDSNQFTPWEIPAEELLQGTTLYTAIERQNGGFALGTIAKGLILLDEEGALENSIQQINGLSNNTILSLKEDTEQNIWLGLDNGINVVNSTSPFKEYQDTFGELGTVYTAAQHQGRLYLGTNQGLFVKSDEKMQTFKLIQNTEGQVWNLTIIDDKLFCGHDKGTFLVDHESAQKISAVEGSWLFRQHPSKKNLIIQGNYDGLHVLEKKRTDWRYRNKIQGFDISSRFFVFASDFTVLISHEYKGVFKLRLNEALTIAEESALETSVNKSYNSSIEAFDDEIYYRNSSGIYRYNSVKRAFDVDSLLSSYFTKEGYLTGKMINDGQGKLWLFSKDQLHFFTKDIFNKTLQHSSIAFDQKNKKSLSGFEHIAANSRSTYTLGGSNGYFTLDVSAIKNKTPRVNLQYIRSRNQTDEKLHSLKEEIILPYASNSFSFDFTAYAYQKYARVEYQTRLIGHEEQWSEWTENPRVDYTKLAFGEYQLLLRARQGKAISSTVNSPIIKIKPPWHLSVWSGMLYTIIALLVMYLYNGYYQRKMKKQQKKLIKKNMLAMEMSARENQEKLIRLKNEKLQNDIESKNRELAVATLSTLKRNEFLNSIKKELSALENEPKAAKLIKTINKKLNSNDEWEYFEKAFENADQDFFKKLKTVHPSLTNNDLKLCAYLRLNLSSKEIAPLLNISVHSVEIKRYRLRKKMELTRKQGIVAYIMTI